MKVIVTGGAGYIGSHTCKELARQGHNPIVYDNLSTGHKSLVQWGEFEYGDILDLSRLQSVFHKHKPDGVIHFAAKSIVSESVSNPGYYFRNNVTGTLNLLETIYNSKVKYIVVSGTCAVYGQPEQMPIHEDMPKLPVTTYGVSKLVMESMLKSFEAAYGLSWVSLRYFNAAGCDLDGETGEWHEPETHLIPLILKTITSNTPLTIFGDDYPTEDGTCVRDYIHVCDLARAHVLALNYLAKGETSEAINLGTGSGFSVRQIIDSVERITGKSVPYRLGQRREGDPPCLISSNQKAASLLGWRPQYSNIDQIIASAWNWHSNFCNTTFYNNR